MTSKNSNNGYRNSRNSKFVKEEYAKKHKATTQKESVPNPGKGNTDRTKRRDDTNTTKK